MGSEMCIRDSSESLFLRIFTPVFGNAILPAMVLARGLGYYSQLLISALFTVVAQLYYTFHNSSEAVGRINRKMTVDIGNERQ